MSDEGVNCNFLLVVEGIHQFDEEDNLMIVITDGGLLKLLIFLYAVKLYCFVRLERPIVFQRVLLSNATSGLIPSLMKS